MELHSDGIVLRSWHPGDAARVFEVCQDPQIQHWLPTHPRPYTDADARAFVTDALGHGPYQLAVVEAGSVVGSVGLHLARHETGGIGYWCAPEARGRGLTTRAVRLLPHPRRGRPDLERSRRPVNPSGLTVNTDGVHAKP